MIQVEDYLNYWKKHYGHVKVPDDELTEAMQGEAEDLITRVNGLLDVFGHERELSSGWRPKSVNAQMVRDYEDWSLGPRTSSPPPRAASRSKHITCNGCDIADPDGKLDEYIDQLPEILEQFGLWRESGAKTKGWCHLQNIPYGSWSPGKSRTFNP